MINIHDLNEYFQLAFNFTAVVVAPIAIWRLSQEFIRSRRENESRAEKALRLDEVTSWGKDVIESLAAVMVLTDKNSSAVTDRDTRIMELGIKTSALIEIGRLYFKNVSQDQYGTEKDSAYRGYRPLVLDYILVAHEICQRWPDISEEQTKHDLHVAAETALRRFVSLIQKEIGRTGSKDPASARAGNGNPLDQILSELKSFG